MSQPRLFDLPHPTRELKIKELPPEDRPRERLQHLGTRALSTTELITIVLNVGTFSPANKLLQDIGDLPDLSRATIQELSAINGISTTRAAQLHAALELGRRLISGTPAERPKITNPADAANLLMSDMMLLEQEELRVIVLNTRNEVLGIYTIYKGSLNTSVVRISEMFKMAIRMNAAAVIVAHNHPSGDPSPSPEDISVTRQLVKAGSLLDIDVLDHLIIGYRRFVSLKERHLGFDD